MKEIICYLQQNFFLIIEPANAFHHNADLILRIIYFVDETDENLMIIYLSDI